MEETRIVRTTKKATGYVCCASPSWGIFEIEPTEDDPQSLFNEQDLVELLEPYEMRNVEMVVTIRELSDTEVYFLKFTPSGSRE